MNSQQLDAITESLKQAYSRIMALVLLLTEKEIIGVEEFEEKEIACRKDLDEAIAKAEEDYWKNHPEEKQQLEEMKQRIALYSKPDSLNKGM